MNNQSLDRVREELRQGSEARHLANRLTPDGKEMVEMIPLEWATEVINSELQNLRQELAREVEKALDESYRKSGQGNRSKFSKDTETRGEAYARTQGFKSAILVSKRKVLAIIKGGNENENSRK